MKDQIVKKAFKKEDVSGYAEARSIIENALDEIDKMTENKDKKINNNQSY
jgi:hypothetical protein